MEGSYYRPVHADNMNYSGLRLCTVRMKVEKSRSGWITGQEDEERKALFHGWSTIAQLVGASPMIGGHPGGTISDTFAIVEYMDGKVERVKPEQIQFLDTEKHIPSRKKKRSE